MRVVFMGTPDFAVPSLRALAAKHQVTGVFTRPDAASGRGKTLRPSAVKLAALELGIPVFQPTTLRDSSVVDELVGLAPQVIVVAAYGMILPADVLAAAPFGCINVHASLLPRWRGAAPIQWAILEGDEVTGVSIMRMEEGLDTGTFCRQVTVRIAEKSAAELTSELAEAGARALLEGLIDLEADRCEWVDQDEREVTYARKIEKADVALAPDLTVTQALRRVRASSAQAPARAYLTGRGFAVNQARVSAAAAGEGAVLCDRTGLHLGFKDGVLEVVRVKPDGKAEMDGAAWARGLRMPDNEQWRGNS